MINSKSVAVTLLTSLMMTSASVASAAPVQSIVSQQKISKAQSSTPDVLIGATQTDALAIAAPYRVFVPQRQTSRSVIDYGVWDDALRNVVLRLGQSVRIRAMRPDPMVGTRIVKGHRSAYRLEGSRVTFSYMNAEYKQGLTEYRQDLEHIANQVDITHLARDEQLAFWFNLHNVTLIEQIALHYPVQRPSKLLIGADKQPLHDAKILKIRGVDLSLRDIREKIVYSNWKSPDVMYGFFHGNIGGPALQSYAFTSDNIGSILNVQAKGFVNSLRGVHVSGRALKVSTLYEEARPYYFANWEADLRNHLRQHANADVLEEVNAQKPIAFDRYDPVVADLLAGQRPSLAKTYITTNGQAQSATISPEVARLFDELAKKTRIMRQRGMIAKRGTVIIVDIETDDPDLVDVYDENEEGSEASPKPEG